MESTPPAYAWDWFARQRLLWREARERLSALADPVATRYHGVDVRGQVTAALREDYPRSTAVRRVVDAVVADLAFLGRTDARFEDIASPTAPRGMRWWWTHLTGQTLDAPRRSTSSTAVADAQLTLDEVLGGYGDDRSGTTRRNRLPDSSGM